MLPASPLVVTKEYHAVLQEAVQLAERRNFVAAKCKLRSLQDTMSETPRETWKRRAAEQMREAGLCWMRSAEGAAADEKAEILRQGRQCLEVARSLHEDVVNRSSVGLSRSAAFN